jgi:chromosome segregation ATPase
MASIGIPEKIKSLINSNVSGNHLDEDLEKPARKDTVPFPADKIRSSLSRMPSTKSIPEKQIPSVAPATEPNTIKSKPINAAVNIATTISDPNDITKAKSQIKTLLKENDMLLGENENQQREIEELELKISSLTRQMLSVNQELKESHDHALVVEDQLFQVKDGTKGMERLLKSEAQQLAAKDADIEQLQDLLRKRQHEIKANLDKQDDLKRALTDLSERYKEILRESSYAAQREKQLLREIEEKHDLIEEMKEKQEEKKHSYEIIHDESEKLKSIIKGLERKVQLFERKEIEFLSKSQQQTHELEEALYERDVATKREQTLLKEIDTLAQKSLDQPRLYQEKHDLAIQSMKSQFTTERRTFCEEVAKLEMLVASLQTQVDRAMREKRAAESELDKITAHLPAETNRLEVTIEELHSKFRASERDKHDAIQKLEHLYNKYQKEQHQYDTERRQSNERLEEAYRRIRSMEREVDESKVYSTNKDKEIQFSQQVSSLEHDRKIANEQMKSMKHQHDCQLNLSTQKYESHISELTAKLENVAESHSTVNRDMQKLLSSQRIMSDKWKEESSHIKEHYEQVLAKIRFELQQYQNRLGESETIIKKLNAQKRDLLDQVSQEKRMFGELHDRYMNLESQNANLKRQVTQLIAKELQVIEEKKQLCRQLDQLLLERDQSKRQEKRYHQRPRIRNALEEFNKQPVISVIIY